MIQSIEQKKRECAQELQLVNQNLRDEAAGATSTAVGDLIPADTNVAGEIQANCKELCLELQLKTNNHCVIKGVIVFAEHLFQGESTFVQPEHPKTALVIPLRPIKDCSIEMLIKVSIALQTILLNVLIPAIHKSQMPRFTPLVVAASEEFASLCFVLRHVCCSCRSSLLDGCMPH